MSRSVDFHCTPIEIRFHSERKLAATSTLASAYTSVVHHCKGVKNHQTRDSLPRTPTFFRFVTNLWCRDQQILP